MTRFPVILLLIVTVLPLNAADHIAWYPKARTFDLEVRNMPVEKFLGLVKAETGWEVMVEPGLDRVVGGKFRNKPAADMMRLLLGRTRFALLPRVKGGTRLMVYSGNLKSATKQVDALPFEAFQESPEAIPDVDDGRLLTMLVKVHYLKSQFPAIDADPKLTNLRPLVAGANEMWQQAGIRFSLEVPKSMRPVDRDAEKTYADLFKPELTANVINQFLAKAIYRMLPDLPSRGKVLHIVVVHTMPQGYGAVYLPGKGVILMPQVKYAKLISENGVWKNGSDVFFAQSNILAHELGHALSLKHVATQGNLMIDGKLREGGGIGPGVDLTQEQIVAARKQAFTGGPHVPGINPKSGLIKPKSGD
jgi:hypothetical protein|tara:strand:- start:2524 stop:3609 length:1086 start_codon:yes stop_codon:yes gene_type:complete